MLQQGTILYKGYGDIVSNLISSVSSLGVLFINIYKFR